MCVTRLAAGAADFAGHSKGFRGASLGVFRGVARIRRQFWSIRQIIWVKFTAARTSAIVALRHAAGFCRSFLKHVPDFLGILLIRFSPFLDRRQESIHILGRQPLHSTQPISAVRHSLFTRAIISAGRRSCAGRIPGTHQDRQGRCAVCVPDLSCTRQFLGNHFRPVSEEDGISVTL